MTSRYLATMKQQANILFFFFCFYAPTAPTKTSYHFTFTTIASHLYPQKPSNM